MNLFYQISDQLFAIEFFIQRMEQSSEPILFSAQFECVNGHPAVQLCLSKECQSNAFICQSISCECKAMLHSSCQERIAVQDFVNGIEKSKEKIPESIQEKIDEINQSYDKMIDRISQSRLSFVQYTTMFGLTQNMLKAVKLLNQGKQLQINSELVSKICQEFKMEQRCLYCPQMEHSQQLNDDLVLIQALLNKFSYIIAKPSERRAIALKTFGQKDLTKDSIYGKSEKNWDFIPYQINAFSNINRIDNNFLKHIRKIINLDELQKLDHLKLDYNLISKIQNLSHLNNLTYLSLQGNCISKIENLEKLANLKQLYLMSNKITKIENLDTLVKLQNLWINYNEIQKLENLDKLINLKELNLGKNKIKILENIQHLENVYWLILSGNPIKRTNSALKIQKQMKAARQNLTLDIDWK